MRTERDLLLSGICEKKQNCLYHLLTHKPNNPFCESCRRAKMKEKREYVGSYKNTATRWGQLVNGDHIVSTQDNMLGIDGNRDMLVVTDPYSGFKAAYPMPDKKADSTADAIKHFMGDRKIESFYSDRSGEMERALRDLHIVSDTSQPGIPQTMQLLNVLFRTYSKELERLY